MKEFPGTIRMKVNEGKHPKPEVNVFDAEVYLNGPVATEVFRRYGVNLRVHMHEPAPKRRHSTRASGW